MSNGPLDRSNVTLDTSDGSLDASNGLLDPSNAALDTSNGPLDPSNVALDASNDPLELAPVFPLYSKYPLTSTTACTVPLLATNGRMEIVPFVPIGRVKPSVRVLPRSKRRMPEGVAVVTAPG
jgi:hypothetical protein